MINIINRYDNCLICKSELVFKHYDSNSLNGKFYKRGDHYLLYYTNKSKLHFVIFDKNFKIIENDGKATTFHLVKHCEKCNHPGLLDPPYFTINKLKSCSMFYHIYLNPRKPEPVVLLQELIRFFRGTASYGWHAKYNVKTDVWNTTVMFVDRSKQIGSIFQKTSETPDARKFSSTKEIIEKIDTLYTFS